MANDKKRHVVSLGVAIVIIVSVIIFLQLDFNKVPVEEIENNEDIDKNSTEFELNQSENVNNENDNENSIPETNYIFDEAIVAEKEETYKRAPELQGLVGFINTNSDISLEKLRGNVVLIDFWTYSCHNCQATLPYVTSWHSTYKDQGLVIIGVHTPEFQYEHDIEGVKNAMEKYGIEYAVVQDNDYKTWRAYQNRYWPRKYLIDIDGFIRYNRIGEGGYEATETVIKELLQEREERIASGSDNEEQTPDISFGYAFPSEHVAYVDSIGPESIFEVSFPKIVRKNIVFLAGEWKYNKDHMELKSDTGTVIIGYNAKSVDISAFSDSESEVLVRIDSAMLTENNKGSDVFFDNKNRSVIVVSTEENKFNIVNSDENVGLLELDIKGKGFRLKMLDFEG